MDDDFTFSNDPELRNERHLLIALFPDREVQWAIAKHRKEWLWPTGRRFPPDRRLHLTLHSVPDTSDEATMRLRTALADIRMKPLNLVLDSSCTWKNDVSVVLPAEHDALRSLHDCIDTTLRRTGFATRRAKWTPHITIARKAAGAARPMRLAPIPWTSTYFALVRSHLSPHAGHEVLTSYRAR